MANETAKAAVAQTEAKQQEETTDTTAAPQESTNTTAEPKKVRRGVASARGTQRLKYTHDIAHPKNGLFIGHLESVELTNILIGADTTGMPSFNGEEIPRITFTFPTNEDDVTKRRYVTLSFNAVESNVLTIPGGKEEWKVNQIFDYIRSILNVFYFKGRALTEEEEDALSLNFVDFDEQGEYSAVDVADVIAGWKLLFENVSNMLNNNAEGKPVFKTKDNKIIPLWIKLLRHVKHNKKGWINVTNGDLAFPSFVGEGVIEIVKQNVVPSIRVDVIKETITPKDIESNKAKAPNMGNGMPNMAGVGIDTMSSMGGASDGFANITADTNDDMPF